MPPRARGPAGQSGRTTAGHLRDVKVQRLGPVTIYLGGALGTLSNWTSAMCVPHARRGHVVRYHRRELDRWLSRGACPGRTTPADA